MKKLRVSECAYDAHVDNETVRRWIRKGRLHAEFSRIGSHRYEISPEEWERFCDDNGVERRGTV
jgi:predicted site-specific integrase-resolvase